MTMFPSTISYLIQVSSNYFYLYKWYQTINLQILIINKARVSLNRITDFLLKEEMEKNDIIYKETKTGIF